MGKENLIALTRELNNQSKSFVSISTKLENEYFHISDFSFSIAKRQYYINNLPEMINVLMISVKRSMRKNKNHIELDVDSETLADKLFASVLPQEINNILCWYISNFSNRIRYVKEINTFIRKGFLE
ncbi:hypothetical protein [uncultured Clostridium sp.]|uniref:hypothetical protein n=1 Tax=uncultured Clostridium sp. TaxID=59620 RepID=UPI0028ED6B50|nr:hypothetical protein [uncultured Clostridium sp.]